MSVFDIQGETLGNFETSVFASGGWKNGESSDWQLRISVHDSSFAAVDYRLDSVVAGRFYLGFQPRDYFEDPSARDPVDLAVESSRFSRWASIVLGTEVDPSDLLSMMAAEDIAEPADVFVEDTVVRLLDRLRMPLPAWLQSQGFMSHGEPAEQGIEKEWANVTASMTRDLETMAGRHYLLVTYDIGRHDYSVYGQFALNDLTFQCEVVSDRFLPADVWPIDRPYLLSNGWSAPDQRNPNWSQLQIGPEEAAVSVLTAMRMGLGCSDPRLFSWSLGTF